MQDNGSTYTEGIKETGVTIDIMWKGLETDHVR